MIFIYLTIYPLLAFIVSSFLVSALSFFICLSRPSISVRVLALCSVTDEFAVCHVKLFIEGWTIGGGGSGVIGAPPFSSVLGHELKSCMNCECCGEVWLYSGRMRSSSTVIMRALLRSVLEEH